MTRWSTSESLLALPESNVQMLLELAKDFEDLAHICLPASSTIRSKPEMSVWFVYHQLIFLFDRFEFIGLSSIHLVPLGRQVQFWWNSV